MTGLADLTGAILAGGFGSRLRSVVADRPKVLAQVRGRPYLTYLLDQLAGAGVREVVLLTGYMADAVQAALGESYNGMRLVYSPEPSPLGTAGALRLALPLVSTGAVLLLNGDSYCDVALADFWNFHRRQNAAGSLVLNWMTDTARFGTVQVTEHRIERFEEKREASGPGWINAGIYLVERQLIEEIPTGLPVSLEREMFPVWAGRHCLAGFRCEGRFLDIGTPQSYVAAETFFRV
jgi:D-glycero-alpha-D-manno-heptose 1-phosphate guanylyltransferase